VVIDALKAHFPKIEGPRKDDICYATQNRQDAVKNLAQQCDVVMVVGSKNSSNSNRLRELSDKLNTTAYLIDNAQEIDPNWLENVSVVGLTAGASAPELLVQNVVERLQELGVRQVNELDGRPEKIEFSLPKELKVDISALSH
jgi:4-hydroxy-3-methylbut-2-enyl diphosphate reductase